VKDSILVSEIFGPTVQGEGPLIGRPTVFVRTGGCDFRCSWCDTLYAVLPEHRSGWTPMSAVDILAKVVTLSGGVPLTVSLSGGNPALQPLAPLIRHGRDRGYAFSAETQGSLPRPWFRELDWLFLSPKPPSSAMTTDLAALDECVTLGPSAPRTVVKVTIFDDADYAFARSVAARYPHLAVYLQAGNPAPGRTTEDWARLDADDDGLRRRYRWLVDKAAADRWFDVTILPQLHVFVWGNKRGV
jgi:7-carboxy-7-deazaguanine synthase